MEKFIGSYRYMVGKNVYYSLEFKKYVLKLLEIDPTVSITMISKEYDIRGTHTIDKWKEQLGMLNSLEKGKSSYIREMETKIKQDGTSKREGLKSENELLKKEVQELREQTQKMRGTIDGLEALISVSNRIFSTDIKKNLVASGRRT